VLRREAWFQQGLVLVVKLRWAWHSAPAWKESWLAGQDQYETKRQLELSQYLDVRHFAVSLLSFVLAEL
jgi:hypothetical protein